MRVDRRIIISAYGIGFGVAYVHHTHPSLQNIIGVIAAVIIGQIVGRLATAPMHRTHART